MRPQEWDIPPYTIDDPPSPVRATRWSWGPDKLKLPEAHQYGQGENTVVCVLDTAGGLDHKDLPAPVDTKIFTGETSKWSSGADHGHHVTGTIHEWSPKADLAIYKVLKNNGSGSTTGIAAAIRHVIKMWNGGWRDKYAFCIISMSLGGGYSADIDNAMRDAAAAGIIIVCAAGNSGNKGADHPGNSKFSYATVGALDQNLNVASFSSRGPEVTVAFPGVNIVSTAPGNNFATLSGSSMSTPAIAGMSASALSTMPHRTDLRDIRNYQAWLHSNCQDLGTPGKDNSYGHGVPIPVKLVDTTMWRFF